MSVNHKAQALVIHCIDFRFQEIIQADLEHRELTGKFDRISYPGASKNLGQVKIASEVSLKLHDPDQVLIYEHEDCAAYGENNSPEIHKENAEKLKVLLKELKPNLEVTFLIATFEGIRELVSRKLEIKDL